MKLTDYIYSQREPIIPSFMEGKACFSHVVHLKPVTGHRLNGNRLGQAHLQSLLNIITVHFSRQRSASSSYSAVTKSCISGSLRYLTAWIPWLDIAFLFQVTSPFCNVINIYVSQHLHAMEITACLFLWKHNLCKTT